MSRQVIMFNIMLRLVNATLFILHRLKLSCRSTFMRSTTSSSSFITSAASPAARPATRQWSLSVSPQGSLCPYRCGGCSTSVDSCSLQWVTPGCLCWRMGGCSQWSFSCPWPLLCLLGTWVRTPRRYSHVPERVHSTTTFTLASGN